MSLLVITAAYIDFFLSSLSLSLSLSLLAVHRKCSFDDEIILLSTLASFSWRLLVCYKQSDYHLVPGCILDQDENNRLLERMHPIRVAIKIALNFRSRGCRERRICTGPAESARAPVREGEKKNRTKSIHFCHSANSLFLSLSLSLTFTFTVHSWGCFFRHWHHPWPGQRGERP